MSACFISVRNPLAGEKMLLPSGPSESRTAPAPCRPKRLSGTAHPSPRPPAISRFTGPRLEPQPARARSERGAEARPPGPWAAGRCPRSSEPSPDSGRAGRSESSGPSRRRARLARPAEQLRSGRAPRRHRARSGALNSAVRPRPALSKGGAALAVWFDVGYAAYISCKRRCMPPTCPASDGVGYGPMAAFSTGQVRVGPDRAAAVPRRVTSASVRAAAYLSHGDTSVLAGRRGPLKGLSVCFPAHPAGETAPACLPGWRPTPTASLRLSLPCC